jgi:hypothetical protein
MALIPWDDATPTDYVDVEVHVREWTPEGYPAMLSVPFVGTFADTLPEPPLRDLHGVETVAPSFGEPPARLYGRQLFEWLFGGRLREGFLKARQLAADSPCTRWRFRVRLGDWEPGSLAALRWEALLYQKDDWRLGLETAFARSRSPGGFSTTLVTDRPLRLWGATTSAATAAGLPADPLGGLLPVFRRNVTRPLGDLVLAEFVHSRLTFAQFEQARGGARKHCVVLGAPVGMDAGAPVVWFDAESAGAAPVSWDQVTEAVCGPIPPELVVVVGPPVGPGWDAVRPPRLAPALHARGVKAVVEVVAPLTAEAITAFAEAVFGRLLHCGMLDEAVAIGRRALDALDPAGWGWTVPVLSLQSSADYQFFHLLPENVEAELFRLREHPVRSRQNPA